jgi:hypothetical protein
MPFLKGAISMSHMIAIPDELYTYLQSTAIERGKTFTDLLHELVRTLPQKAAAPPPSTPPIETEARTEPSPLGYDDDIIVPGYDPTTDPLARFAGIYASDEPGWIERHDLYIYGAEEPDADES